MFNDSPLAHLGEFKKVLQNYKPSIEAIEVLSTTPIVLLVAPAASGRNTIIRNLILTGRYYFVVSDTTRRPRINNGVPERSGQEYWFRSEEEFLDGLRRGEYVAPAIIHEQQVSGMPISEIREAAKRKLIAITDIDLQGSDIMQSYAGGDTHYIFVLPPDFDEWMRRMDGRGAMDPHEKRRRLSSAIREIQGALDRPYFKFVVNWDLRRTTEELHEEIVKGMFDEARQTTAKSHAQELLDRLQKTV